VEGGVSLFMQKVGTAYSMYFNKKYARTGSLFEGKFKSSHIDNDRYLKYLFSYIHLNPLKIIEPRWKENGIKDKKKIFSFLRSYSYSSYLSYSADVKEKIVTKNYFPSYFPNKQSFEKEILDWIVLKEY
jgi:putative transposase